MRIRPFWIWNPLTFVWELSVTPIDVNSIAGVDREGFVVARGASRHRHVLVVGSGIDRAGVPGDMAVAQAWMVL